MLKFGKSSGLDVQSGLVPSYYNQISQHTISAQLNVFVFWNDL